MDLDNVMVSTKWKAGTEHVVHVTDAETGEVVAEVIVNVTGPVDWKLTDAKTRKPVREELEQMAFSLATYAASCVGENASTPAKKKKSKAKKRA